MPSDRTQRVYELFHAVGALPAADREPALRDRCGDDEALFDQVLALLATGAADDDASSSRGDSPDVRTVIDDDTPARRAARIPDHIGPYRIVHELGHGGMGMVYLGVRDEDRFKRRAAVKVLKRGMDTEEVLRRFELERQLLAALNHPNIARVYDAGETEQGLPYFAMEYVEGLRVDEYCDRHRLGITERLELFRSICSAVHYAHQNLVVHRDLKPSNIVMTRDGVPKLLDFGIAKLINPDVAIMVGDPTAPGMRVMTPEYASPEQVLGEPITTASDVYSLGVLLYELVSGHRPYRLASHVRTEIEHVICEVEPDKPSTAISHVEAGDGAEGAVPSATETITPESVSKTREGRPDRLRRRLAGDVDNIVLMAMRKEPQRRYSSAEQFGEDIRRHLAGLTVIARRDTIGYRVSKFVRRNHTGVAAAVLVILTLVVGIAGTSWQAHVAGIQRDAAESARQDVYELTHTFMFDFYTAIEQLEGSLAARAMLVETSLSYLDGLTAEAGDDRAARRELATAYDRMGDIQGGIRNPSRADRAGALESYRKGLEIRKGLFAGSPDDRDLESEVVTSLTHVADMLREGMGDVAGALTLYREVLAIGEARVKADPQDVDARRGLALALNAVGTALLATGDAASAKEHYERSLALRQQLVRERPEALRLQRDLAVAHGRMGGRLEDEGDLEGALDHYARGIEIRERLVLADPTSDRFRRDLAWAHCFAGQALLALGRMNEGAARIDQFFSITEQRANDDPGNARAQRDLALGLQVVGMVRAEQDDLEGALASYRRSMEVAMALSATAPRDTSYRGLIADSHAAQADVRSRQGDRRGAIKSARDALDIVTELAKEDPSDARRQEQKARLHLVIGNELLETGEIGAERELESALSLYRALAEAQPESDAIRFGLASVLHAHSKITALGANREAAVQAAEEALRLLSESGSDEETEALRQQVKADLLRYRR